VDTDVTADINTVAVATMRAAGLRRLIMHEEFKDQRKIKLVEVFHRVILADPIKFLVSVESCPLMPVV
jgi:hypothetical protein